MASSAPSSSTGHPATLRPGTEGEWAALIEAQIGEGQFFLAYDTYREAVHHWPDSLRLRLQGVLALLRGGAIEEAQRALQPLEMRLETRRQRQRRVAVALRRALADPHDDEGIALTIAELQAAARPDAPDLETPETLRLIIEIQIEIWVRLGERHHIEHGRDIAEDAYQTTGSAYDGITAAVLMAMTGDVDKARTLAARVRDEDAPADGGDAEFLRYHITRGTASLVLGETDAAVAAFGRAVDETARHYPTVIGLLDRLDLIAHAGIDVPRAVTDLLRLPRTAIFAGQPLDHPDAETPTFPVWAENRVAEAIRERLAALDIEVGYCGASAGSDLLFIEAMLDRGAEVHVFLPFAFDDFVAHRVAYAGGTWERRFRNAMKLVTSVTYATEEPYLGHDVLLRYNNTLIEGVARVQSIMRRTQPELIVVWDHEASTGPGSTADFMDGWPDITRLHLIDLDDARAAAEPPMAPPPARPGFKTGRQSGTSDRRVAGEPPAGPHRVIRTMLFADMAGYSRMGDGELPGLWEGLGGIADAVGHHARSLTLIESWGDAIYAVMQTATALADYAFALLMAIDAHRRKHQDEADTIPLLELRVALHAGPVYQGINPLTGRDIVYGSQVSRAARIEPVSLAGHVYASQQFVAMLVSEQNAERHAAEATGGTFRDSYACEYIGNLSLAKNYGRQPIYRIRRLAE
ncbi:adenylate/guanylate cyclase domain-containing protein [Fodinicurvata sp. EGI_FJ10296]|uniref:adenylate/guanylate cyclase domain-containing protein n=1 Tax=Fodinicurvata sp. EGI_FJ10296 TaxID=3231908 RepID=UPI003453BFA3